ncbi:hypothetical protein PENCOP_c018G04079 [Penicillium coprophilum]|uniref:DUF7779 domain-containing protein n=1 Tax=Penicillium coprophilum TaxID=36646 RepID=A0A1V6U7F3_9EURO|nr:hypothetical protein PENCOP_c018G04079 [Penicillium coprophilum]
MTSISFGNTNSGLQAGVVNGTINAQFYLHPERLETPPTPVSTVPFRRDPDFVSRDTLLDQIYEKISVPGSRIALVGVGGVGKSQLAIEYCYRLRDQSPDTWVFWVHASNAARFEQSFRDIADQVKIPGRQDPTANLFQLVESWLRDWKGVKWLLILDNVDDDGFLRQPSTIGQQGLQIGHPNAATKPLLEFLPRSPNGSIIITSRNREVASKIVHHQDVIKIDPMNRSEALKLFQQKLGRLAETPETLTLVEELEFMPLAIVQAAGYIAHRAPRCSVSQYLEKFRKSDGGATKLLHYEAGHLYRDWEAKNSILVTWQISFDYIRRIRPSAADLLSLMSFFDRQGISEDLLRVQSEIQDEDSSSEEITFDRRDEDTDSTSESDTDDEFDDDLTILRDFSFIFVSEKMTVFTMHRLVQLTVRVWLKTNGQIERWKEEFITRLYQRFPTGEYENWARCRSLFPHMKSAVSQRPESQDCLHKWATLLYKGAWYAHGSGNIAESRNMAFKSRRERVLMFGLEGEHTLDSTAMLANVYRLEGRWEEAEQLEVQVMETCKTKLGVDHPSTLRSMANLASTFWNQGRWEEAEQLGVQVMETSKTKLGVDHPSTLTSMANLASTFWNQGRWEEAEQLGVQVMEISKAKLGVDHPDTLMSIGNLASIYRNQGRWNEAEQLGVQVLETRKTKLGVDHPDTLTSIGNLASTYRNQGRWEEAEQLELQVMDTSKTKLGVDHPSTLTSMANLASTFWNQGRWEEAEQLDVQVMETSKTKLGVDHPSTLTSMANLASTFWNQGRWEEAELLELQVMETCKTKLSVDHPSTLTSMANLASTYKNQDRWEEAEQLEVQVLETRKTKLGVDHPSTLTSMANLASTFWNQGRWEEAEQLGVQVIETRKTKLGVDHPDTLTSMANLAHTLWSSGQYTAALQLMAECIQLSDRKLGPDHPHTISSQSAAIEWRGKVDSLSSQLTKSPTGTKEVSTLDSSSETPKRVSDDKDVDIFSI